MYPVHGHRPCACSVLFGTQSDCVFRPLFPLQFRLHLKEFSHRDNCEKDLLLKTTTPTGYVLPYKVSWGPETDDLRHRR